MMPRLLQNLISDNAHFWALFGLLWVVLGLSIPTVAHTADSYILPTATQQVIEEHGVCRYVSNTTGQSIFIPTKTAAEWSSFYNNTPPNVTAPVCASCSLDGVTVAHGDSYTFYMSTRPCYSSCGSVSQLRNCYNGTLDGSASYEKSSCPSESCASCLTETVNWTTSTYSCAATATGGSHNTTRNVSDSAAPGVGSAAFTCANGTWAQDSGSCGGASCALPWGGTINDGQSTAAYLNASEPCGGSCTSQTRTCSDGTLSGSYTNQSCSVTACLSCSLPWGGSINHGTSTTAYLSSSVTCGNSCTDETRSCNDGSLSGSYQYETCSTGTCSSCTLDGVTVNHGDSRTFYETSRSCGATCGSIAQSRTCNNGTLSGSSSYSKASCPGETCASCSLPWGGSISHGNSATAYLNSSEPCGSSCTSQSRTCNDGSLSGSYTNQSCSVSSCGCTLPWGGSISDGQSVTAYQSSSVSCGSSCLSETRTCSGTTLSGSYQYETCSVGACSSCTLDGVTVSHGSSRTFYESSRSCGTSCSSIDQSRTCNNGTLSGSSSYSKATCPAESCASCTSPWGTTVAHNSSVTAYLNSSEPCGGSCTSQSRTCSNGSLSGSYTSQSCSVSTCANCTAPDGSNVNHGSCIYRYSKSTTDRCGGYCETCNMNRQSFCCNDGTLSNTGSWSSYPHTSCTETCSQGLECY